MATIVYFMCAATSLGCAVMLLRVYTQNRTALLLWSGLCFVGLGMSNSLLVVDLVFVPDVDLSIWRNLFTFAGLSVLLYGLVWHTR